MTRFGAPDRASRTLAIPSVITGTTALAGVKCSRPAWTVARRTWPCTMVSSDLILFRSGVARGAWNELAIFLSGPQLRRSDHHHFPRQVPIARGNRRRHEEQCHVTALP